MYEKRRKNKKQTDISWIKITQFAPFQRDTNKAVRIQTNILQQW